MRSLTPSAPTGQPGKRTGFTLIELLIVVAIIAILAAIAVPNFLEAQTRSKVARVLADHRTNRTAVEAYAVDWNKHPRSTWPGIPIEDTIEGFPVAFTLPKDVTTPIAYVSSIFRDPFAVGRDLNFSDRLYSYTSMWTLFLLIERGISTSSVPGMAEFFYVVGSQNTARRMQNYLGEYYLWSAGPAGPHQHPLGSVHDYFIQYDPTNGTVSWGRVFVTHKHSAPTYVPNEYIMAQWASRPE